MPEEQEHGEKKHASGGHTSHGPPHGGHEEAHEGAPEWLISFADNVTLMMGFFVILFALNLKNAASSSGGPPGETAGAPLSDTMLDTIIAIREAFNSPVDINSADPVDLPLILRMLERGESEAARDGQVGREHDVRSVRPSKYYGVAGLVPFGRDSSALSDVGKEHIQQILDQMRGRNLVVDVRGHVSAAESFGSPERAMELSYQRALSVARYLADEGIPWNNLRLIACADHERLSAVVYDDSGHDANQRVEIVVTDEIVKPIPTAEE